MFQPKTCLFCGKTFIPNSPKQNICKDKHYSKCPDCGKPVLIRESYSNFMKNGPRRCFECRNKVIGKTRRSKTDEEKQEILHKMQTTMIKKYGAKSPLQVECIKQKFHDTIKHKYGVDNLSQSPEIQAKIHENSLAKYGVDHYSQDPTIRNRMKHGMIERYGVSVPLQNSDIHNRQIETNLERYGVDNVAKSDIVKEHARQHNLNKYGVEWAAQSKESIEKRTRTNIEKYGAPAFIFSDEFLSTLIQDPSKKNYYIKFKHDPKTFILEEFDDKPTYKQISDKTGLSTGQIGQVIKLYNLQDLVTFNKSNMENEVFEFIRSIDDSCIIERNNRSIIYPKEIDIYLPEYKLGFECNPTFTHNSSFPSFGETTILPPSYHKMKTDMAEKAGIFLFHIFGYEWTWKQDNIKSIIKNIMHKNSNKIYARNTSVVELPQQSSFEFLSSYHRQGYMNSSIRLGLVYDDKLVSVMCFNKPRKTLGYVKTNYANPCELGRFCTISDTSVVGGASKLFKYFLNNYDFDYIYSFSDRARTRGSLYSKLEFHKESISSPDYVWVNMLDDSYFTRTRCQKRNLPKLFNEDIDTEVLSERAIMESHNYGRVFNSGVIRWGYEH